MIKIEKLKVVAGDFEIIKNADMNITDKVILLGPNGSGKTTLLRCICGIRNYKGYIYVDGMEVKNVRKLNSLSCNLPEAWSLGLTLNDKLEIYEEIKDLDISLAKEMLKQIGMSNLKKKYYELSSGQNIMFYTILALASRPKHLIIDEPFENVDYAKRKIIANWLREIGLEGIIVTHELDMLELFEEYDVYLIFEGKVFGHVKVKDFLESSFISGEDRNAILTVEIKGRKYSLIKTQEGNKVKSLMNLDKLYLMI